MKKDTDSRWFVTIYDQEIPSDVKLTPSEKWTYTIVKSFTAKGKLACQKSYLAISRRAGSDDGSVKKSIKSLISKDLLFYHGNINKRGGSVPILTIREGWGKRDVKKTEWQPKTPTESSAVNGPLYNSKSFDRDESLTPESFDPTGESFAPAYQSFDSSDSKSQQTKETNKTKNATHSGNSDINAVKQDFLAKTGLPVESGSERQNRKFWKELLENTDFLEFKGVEGVKLWIALIAINKKEQYPYKINSAKDLFYKRADLYSKYILKKNPSESEGLTINELESENELLKQQMKEAENE